jgi:uncharacterized protein
MKRVTLLLTAICLSLLCFPSVEGKRRTKTQGDGPTPYHGPIIDMHLHAMPIDSFGPPPHGNCPNYPDTLVWDPRQKLLDFLISYTKNPPCAHPVWSPTTDEDLMNQTLEILERRNIVAVTSGPSEFVFRWKAAAPKRIIPGSWIGEGTPSLVPLDSLRTWLREGRVAVLGELSPMLAGLAPGDAVFEPYLALADEFDVPVGIHMGAVIVGGNLFSPGYRAKLGSPLLLEDVLVRHPKLRVYVMHAGWPMVDEMLALLDSYPQVYLDISFIDFALPLPEFHRYLQRLIDAGFRHRVLFGSDQMIWPPLIDHAIKAIESAPFLTEEQRGDIFYKNAARFLRLEKPNRAQ